MAVNFLSTLIDKGRDTLTNIYQSARKSFNTFSEQEKYLQSQVGAPVLGGQLESPGSKFLRETKVGKKISETPLIGPTAKFLFQDSDEVINIDKKLREKTSLTLQEKKIAQNQNIMTVGGTVFDMGGTKSLKGKPLGPISPAQAQRGIIEAANGGKMIIKNGVKYVENGAQKVLNVGGGKYNIADLDFSDDVAKIFVDVAEKGTELIENQRRGTISFNQTRQAVNEMFGKNIEWLKNQRPGKALNDSEITRAFDIAKTFFEETLMPLQKSYADAVSNGTSTAQMKIELLEKMNEGAVIQSKVLGAASELGRALNARKIIKQALADPTQEKLEQVLKSFGGAENSNQIIKRFNELTISDPSGKQAYQFLRSMNKTNFFEKANWYWLNSILSGPRTQEKNILSNAINVVLRPIDKTFSAVADIPRTAIGKTLGKDVERERFLGEAVSEVLSIRKGFVEGLGKFLHVMRNGYNIDDVGKLELSGEPITGRVIGKNIPTKERISGATAAIVGFPLRTLSASDQLFKSIIFNMELGAQAYRLAAQEEVDILSRGTRATEILRDPSEEMISNASEAALKGTFQQAFKEGGLAKRIANLRNWEVQGVQPLRFVIPFIQTPINVMKVGLERGPITGPLKAMVDVANSQGGKRSDALGRLAFASTTAATLGMLAFEGRISGDGPKNEKDKALLRTTGWQPNSVRVTNPFTGKETWVSYKGIAPVDQMFAQMASLHEEFVFNNTAPTEEKIANIGVDLLRNINNQTFMSGLADWLEALNNPDSTTANKFFSRLGASFIIPNLVRTVAQAQDRVLRESKTFTQQLKTGVPGLSQTVEPRLDAYDTPIVFEGSALLPNSISSEQIPSLAVREALQIKQNAREANLELEQGKFPTKLDKGRANLLAAEYMLKRFNEADTQEEAVGILKELKEKEIITKDVSEMAELLRTMDEAGLTKRDREMLLYPPGAVRGQLIIDRLDDFSSQENRDNYLQTLNEADLLDEDTTDAIRVLNTIRKEKREKASPNKKEKSLSSNNIKNTISELVQSAGRAISDITPTTLASDDGKRITSIEIEDDEVITTYTDKKGTFSQKTENIDKDLNILESIGKVFNDVGTSLNLPEFNISEFLKYEKKEERIKKLLEYNDLIKNTQSELEPDKKPQKLETKSLEVIREEKPITESNIMPGQKSNIPKNVKIKEAINFYGGENAPLHKYENVISEAVEKYDLFRNNPYLIPVISHLETSSGRNITRPNNLINYGIRSEKINELFKKVGVEEALRRSLKEMAETGTVYKKFNTGKPLTDEEIIEFAKIYEPENDSYPENLLNGIRSIESKLTQ